MRILYSWAVLLTLIFIPAMINAQSGTFRNGVKQGLIKVKFSQELAGTLRTARINPNPTGFTSGITPLDLAAKVTKARTMYRLFPYDQRFEHKLRKHGLHLWYVVEIDDAADPKAVASEFRKLKEVAVAEVEREKVIAPYTVQPYVPGASTMSLPPFNDPFLKDQWHYDNTGQLGVGDADIDLFEAWTTTTGANNIIVSVHDEGVDVKHADLKDNIWVNTVEANGQPGVDDDGNGYTDDINGYNFVRNRGAIDAQMHGTHVAGTIAAVNNNGIGVAGVAGGNGSGNGVKVMSMQILGGSSIEKSYVYAANNGAVISQNSWGYSTPGYMDEAIKDAIEYFIAEAGDYPGSPMRGGIVLFAAGNSNVDDQAYPGYMPSVMAIASIGTEWQKASYSNFGEWIELSAPGGEQSYGARGGVLSTVPKDQYAYLQGTSMACPHVSGIAALALANRTKQITNTELWNKLVTGTISIEEHNAEYQGKLGTGAIDAVQAIRNDQGIAPQAVATLALNGISQEFAQLKWTVPADADDGQPRSFTLYYHTQPLTEINIHLSKDVTIPATGEAGSEVEYEIENLLSQTTYYFAIKSTDRWGNTSELSNVITGTTNSGPAIAVDENSTAIEIEIDAELSTTATREITIMNKAEGILRWEHSMRHRDVALGFNISGIQYPTLTPQSKREITLGRSPVHMAPVLRSNDAQTMSFTPVEKVISETPTNIIGETDLTLPNSAAVKFFVSEPEGFNLTNLKMYLKHNPEKGPVIVEVFKGNSPERKNLLYAQEYSSWSSDETWAYVDLDEQLYFEQGTTFWVAFHVPQGNLFPLGIGFEAEPQNSTLCYYSTDVGTTWTSLEEVLVSKSFAWNIIASSENEHLGTYLALAPGSGDVAGFGETPALLTLDATSLRNGTYTANLVLSSNDVVTPQLRIPVSLTVKGHQPQIRHVDIADFGAVFIGNSKILDVEIENTGFGNLNDVSYSTGTPAFTIEGYGPGQLQAQEKYTIQVKYSPQQAGNANDILTIASGDKTYQIALFGVGAETSAMQMSPESQSFENLTIGAEVKASIKIENTGAYPLKYFIPGFDNKGISSDWPTTYHTYGYKVRSNFAPDPDLLTYAFEDISASGIEITDQLLNDDKYVAVDLGFSFPFYATFQDKIYIAQKGFTTFDNSVAPINTPVLNNSFSPGGYISPLGTFLTYVTQGQIFYKVEAERIIIQYDNVTDGVNGPITVQMVLYANGNIRFYYEEMNYPVLYLNVLMENTDKQDGILINNYEKVADIVAGTAIGFDYPGPNIITGIVNGSGLLMPGNSADVEITLSSATLVEGLTNRYINFISNDPAHAQQSALIQLNVTDGGVAKAEFSTNEIAFGDVFQGAIKTRQVMIRNTGSAELNISAVAFDDDKFLVDGGAAAIRPGLYKIYRVTIPTTGLGHLEDVLTFNFADGTEVTVAVSGTVVVAPDVTTDLSLLSETLSFGETSNHPITISNPGAGTLEVTTAGTQWLSFETTEQPGGYSYVVEKHNNGDFYQWLDIRKTGTHLPFLNLDDPDTFWRQIDLPFEVPFYGVNYSSIKIGENGILSFEEDPTVSIFTDNIPSETHDGPCIMPYWTFSSFSTMFFPAEDVGIFYQHFDDKVVILWSYFINNFGGMGDPVSAQIIIYKNGTMKFQYRVEGANDLTSHLGTIGLQKDSETGIAISEYLPLDFKNGLAYIIVPAEKYTITPGSSLTGNIKLDATNLYGGTYHSNLTIETNVPGKETLLKPAELVVEGVPVFSAAERVDFETRMAISESGSPVTYTIPVDITNTGNAALDISWIAMQDGTQGMSFQVYMLVDGWFGPEWMWVDVKEAYAEWNSNPPLFTLKPGDILNARASFAPEMAGVYADEVILTTSSGEERIDLNGIAVEPPVVGYDNTAIEETMDLPSTQKVRTVVLSNDGNSDLEYSASIEYLRESPASAEPMNIATGSPAVNPVTKATGTTPEEVTMGLTDYARVISYFENTTPENFVGTGGNVPFSIATKYNAGSAGFAASHVEVVFRTETVSNGEINVEVRAGGTSVADAVTVAEGKWSFASDGTDASGGLHAIKLDDVARIYPNEDFYVVVTYPIFIEHPQGVGIDEEMTSDRYFYESEGLWYDLSELSDFDKLGWLMFAGEAETENNDWLKLTSGASGVLKPGETASLELTFDGTHAQRGDQVAQVVIASNDPVTPEAVIHASLHLNEPPVFAAISNTLNVNEGEQATVLVPVTDREGNAFTVGTAQTYENMTYTFSDGILEITVSPDFGADASYTYEFVAVDEFDAQNTWQLVVTVGRTNREPLFVAAKETLDFTATGELIEFPITDFFQDPDGDELTFVLNSADNEIARTLSSAETFAIKPVSEGETDVIFSVSDGQGGVIDKTIHVRVSAVMGAESKDKNFSLSVFPNPTKGEVFIHLGGEMHSFYKIRITNAMGMIMHETTNLPGLADRRLDLSGYPVGIYFIEISDGSGISVRRVIKE